ncbi:MAG TPA: hypothetical protein VD995_09715 [Azospirillum sp.]|nr:hypothetical protein [Azospirillum sp.]
MRGKWVTALLVTATMAGAAHGAAAAERLPAGDTIELWSWRGQPAVQDVAPAPKHARLTDTVQSGRSSDLRVISVATAPDAPTKPMPDHKATQMLSTPMLAMPNDDLPDDVKSAWGCLIGGTVGTGVALAANAENLINVIAGGIVAPASPAVLAIGLAGVVFGTFCTIGQAFTPLYVHYLGTPADGQPPKEVAMSNARPPANRPPDVVVNLSGRR